MVFKNQFEPRRGYSDEIGRERIIDKLPILGVFHARTRNFTPGQVNQVRSHSKGVGIGKGGLYSATATIGSVVIPPLTTLEYTLDTTTLKQNLRFTWNMPWRAERIIVDK